MSNRKIINSKNYIEKMDVSGESYIAGRDIHRYGENSSMTMQDFQNLLTQISKELNTVNLSGDDKKVIQTNVEFAKAQSKIETPVKSLILGPLTTAFDLLVQAGGAATAVETIMKLLRKAIAFTDKMF